MQRGTKKERKSLCPVAGCGHTIRIASYHIERDDALKRQLESVPSSVPRVWVDRDGKATAAEGAPDPKRLRTSIDLAASDAPPTVAVDESRRRYWAERAAKTVKQEPPDE